MQITPFDAAGQFQPVAQGIGLRRLAVRGAGFTVFGQSLGFVIQMVATVVLARLITPADFGLVIMVTTFSLLLVNFGLNGVTEVVLQREKLDSRVASNLFWITAASGLLLTLAFAGAAPLVARFYGDARLIHVTRALSATILLTSLSVVHLALLRRAMRFAVVSANDIAARAVAVIASVLLAILGLGYWALVAAAIALPLATCAGAWLLCRWRPGPPKRDAGTLPMIRFALHVYGRFTANYLTWNLGSFLLGWRFGAAPLGFYKKAYDLFILPLNQLSSPLTNVAVSALSRLADDRVQYRRYFLSALSTLAFVGMGLGAVLTLAGRDLILLLLGPGWEEAGRIFTFFGPGIGIMLLYYTHGWIHLSVGRADRGFRWGLVEVAVTGSCLLIGLQWGPVGVAIGWVASLWILTIPALWYAGRPVSLGIAPVIGAVWTYVVASGLAGVVSAAVIRAIPVSLVASASVGAFVRIVAISLVFGTLYVLAVVMIHRGLAPIRQVLRLAGDMLPRRRRVDQVELLTSA
jgi:O-antigen/teichoic acid export membrane protein